MILLILSMLLLLPPEQKPPTPTIGSYLKTPEKKYDNSRIVKTRKLKNSFKDQKTNVDGRTTLKIKKPGLKNNLLQKSFQSSPVSFTLGLKFDKKPVELSLEKALKIARSGNIDIRITALSIEEAKISKNISKYKLYPIIKVESSALFWNDKLEMGISLPDDIPIAIDMEPILIRKWWTVQSKITIAQPITPWFSLKSLYQLDKAEVIARKSKLRIEQRKIRAEVEKAYYNCLKADSYFAVIKDAEKMLAEQEKRVRALLHAKLITDTELSKILSGKSQLKAQKIKVIAASLLSRQYLAYLLGLKLTTRLKLTTPIETKRTILSPQECSRLAMRKRPAFDYITQKKQQVEYAKKALNFSRLPQILAVAQYQNSLGFGSLQPTNQFFAGVTFSWQYSWKNKSREMDKIELKNRELELNRKKTKRGITLEIHKNHLEMIAAKALIKAREEALNATKSAYQKLNLQLAYKYTTNSDLLTARSELTKSQVNLLNAKNSYLLAKRAYLNTCQ
jgi:outer membrane protein TolC